MKINYILRFRPYSKPSVRGHVVKYTDKATGKKRVRIKLLSNGDEDVFLFHYNPVEKKQAALGFLARSVGPKRGEVPLRKSVALDAILCRDGIRFAVEEVEAVRPKGLTGDITNYWKGIEDALNKIVWADDKLVVSLKIRFSRAPVDDEPDESELKEKNQAELNLGGQDSKDAKIPF